MRWRGNEGERTLIQNTSSFKMLEKHVRMAIRHHYHDINQSTSVYLCALALTTINR